MPSFGLALQEMVIPRLLEQKAAELSTKLN